MRRQVFNLALLAALAGCASRDEPAASGRAAERPPWADGRMIRERAPAAAAADRTNLAGAMLAAHNRERAAIGAPPLTWDSDLAAAAAAYGPALSRLGRLAHSESSSRPDQGENLWMGTRGAFTLAEMSGSWAEEKKLFRPGTFPDVSASGHWSDVAHYTQMIWPGSRRVGCALYGDPRWDYLICRYAPAGNVVGERVP
jgi:hypothetical protein